MAKILLVSLVLALVFISGCAQSQTASQEKYASKNYGFEAPRLSGWETSECSADCKERPLLTLSKPGESSITVMKKEGLDVSKIISEFKSNLALAGSIIFEIKSEESIKVDGLEAKKLKMETTVKSTQEKIFQEAVFVEKGETIYLIAATYKKASAEEDFKNFLNSFKLV